MAEREEGLWMSTKERDRLKVLHEVKKRHITQKQAGAELGLSERWIRELLLRVRRRGDAGLRHGLRGRASNRKTPERVKRRVVELLERTNPRRVSLSNTLLDPPNHPGSYSISTANTLRAPAEQVAARLDFFRLPLFHSIFLLTAVTSEREPARGIIAPSRVGLLPPPVADL